MRYIATREGVEKLAGNSAVTKGQRELIQKLLHDFPDAVELFEYEDYCRTPTLGTASAFISMALDANLHEIDPESGYMQYIATRPRVQKRGTHGLFSSATAVDLASAISELEAHEGNVWTIIYSLRREDAARLEYDNADAWRTLLMENAPTLAKSMKISLENFHWYAAFHDEGHHPHIHMMVWSDDPKEGFLTKDGIAAMRSKLTNAIFRDEMQQIYGRKDVAYPDAVTMLLGGELGTAYPSAGERTEEPVKPFALPPANKDMRRVFAYLIKHRSIARDVVAHFAKAGLLYEDAEYHNAVFVGTDVEGVPRHAHKRSANSYGKAFRLNVEGSDPRYSFHYVGTDRSLYVFEAPIDMLSFITLYPENWQRHSYVACCGTSIQPVLQMLEQTPQLDTVLLCLDNDEAGHQASRRMREQLEVRYSVECLIPENKDWNDDLTLSDENAQGFAMNELR